jgi:type I restriction enzyme S subunit
MDRGHLPEGWEVKKLGEVCKFQGGSQPPKSGFSPVLKEGYVRLIQIRDYKSDKHIVFIPKEKARRFCTKEDVMIGRYGPPVFQILRGLEGAYNVALMKATPDESQLLKDFLFHFLTTPKIQQYIINLSARAAGQSGLNKATIEPYFIPIPSLDEQKRIVAILDEAFEGIDQAIRNTEKNLANARELFDSYLNKIFTQKGDDWEERKLGNVCSIKHGFAFKSEFFTNEKSKYVLLTPGSFYESGGYREQGEKTKYYTGDIPEGFILKKGDFLFAMTEQAVGLLGSSLIVPELDRFLHNQRLGLVQVVDNFEWHNDFFFHQCNTQKFRAAVQNSASGVKVRHTSPNKLGAIIIAFPKNIREQKIIADNLNELHTETQHLETIYRQKIAALNELKQSILQKAFTGQLTSKKSL